MSHKLYHLCSGYAVDQAIETEEEKVIVIRFGTDTDPECMKTDHCLAKIAEKVRKFATIYLVDIAEVPDFNEFYELVDSCSVMFFHRNRHIKVDMGTGNNNKINWGFDDKNKLAGIVETVYRGAKKGKGQVTAPDDYSTKCKY